MSEEMAAVGSISHILHTAFKDVYEETAKREQAPKARVEREARRLQREREAELKAIEDERIAAEAAKAAAAPAAKGKGGKQPEPVHVPEPEPEPVHIEEPDQPLDEDLKDADFYSHFETLSLSEKNRSNAEERKLHVDSDLLRRQTQAKELIDYLHSRKALADELEIQEKDDLKRQGIMVGQHIPSLPSKLVVESTKIAEYDSYSKKLVVAKSIIEQNQENRLRRTGNLPISQLAVEKKIERGKYQSTLDDDTPHYLESTQANAVRTKRTLKRFEETRKVQESLRPNTEVEKGSIDRFCKPKREVISMAEKLEHMAVLKSVNHKLNYLRNPKGNPDSISRLIVRTKEKVLEKEKLLEEEESAIASSSGSRMSSSSSLKSKYGKQTIQVRNNPLFVADPPLVRFNDYEIGKKYQSVINFRNVSAVSRQVRVVPPTSGRFSMGPLKFPASCKDGFLAPGISVSAVITFSPSTLQECTDTLMVQTEGGSYDVKIVASRTLPVLDIPENFNLGVCLLGDAVRVVMHITNTGGQGQFTVLSQYDYSNSDYFASFDTTTSECLRLLPFAIYPNNFILGANESTVLNIEFVPRTVGSFSADIVIVSDIKQAWKCKVFSECRLVTVSISEINEVPLSLLSTSESDNFNALSKDIAFDASVVGTETYQQVLIENNSGVPLEYEWVWVNPHVSNVQKAVKKALAKRASMSQTPSSPTSGNRPKTTTLSDFENTMNFKNSVSEGPFSVSPACGVIGIDGSCSFSFSFSPQEISIFLSSAVMVLKDTPSISIPSKLCQDEIKHLEQHGHGFVVKLRSWIDNLGSVTPLPSETRLPSKLVQLQKIVDMVERYSSSKIHLGALTLFKKWVRLLVEHFVSYRLHSEEDEESLGLMDVDMDDETEEHDCQVTVADWTGNSEDVPIELTPFPLHIGVEESSENVEEDSIFERSGKYESDYYREIWINEKNAILLLGHTLSKMLDDEVGHEAVDYIQQSVRTSNICMSIQLSAESQRPVISIFPAELRAGEAVCCGKSFHGSFLIKNGSMIMTDVHVDFNNVTLMSLTDLSAPLSEYSLTFNPSRVLSLPQADTEIKFEVLIDNLGSYKLTIPLISNNAGVKINSFVLFVTVIPPKIRFETPEIDFGLIGVGNEASNIVRFTNESDAPARFRLVPTITTALTKTQSNLTQGSLVARDSFAADDPYGSLFSEANTSVLSEHGAVININSASSFIGPGETQRVELVCITGTGPQRLRGVLNCIILDRHGENVLSSQTVAIKGEIQAPKVILYPMKIDMGKVYLKRSVSFTITLENITNLPTKFKIEKPGEDNPNYMIEFSQMEGTLSSKEVLKIDIKLTALKAGIVEDLYACKITGTPAPIGFLLKSVLKGIDVQIKRLQDGEVPPPPLASPDDAQFPGPGQVPDASPILPIVLGENVPLYERRSVKVVMQNLSAVPAPFDFDLKKFKSGLDKTSRKGAVGNVEIKDVHSLHFQAKVDGKLFVLQPQEEGENKFNSVAGKKYIGIRSQRVEDKKYLSLGLGGSYLVEPKYGTLPPWGVVVFTIRSFNDTPGCYDDEVVITLNESNSFKRLLIPVKLSVKGCPVLIEKDVIGMTETKPHGTIKAIGNALLHVGSACVNADALCREFYVKNNGSQDAKICWVKSSATAKVNGPLKVEIGFGESGRVKSVFRFWDDVAEEIPFLIEPKQAVIAPYGREKFKVSLTRTSQAGEELALLSCIIWNNFSTFEEDEIPSGKPDFNLPLYLRGDILNPSLRLDKNIFTVTDSVLRVSHELGVKLKIEVPQLFGSGLNSYTGAMRTVTIENPLMATVLFSISTSGTFQIKPSTETFESSKKTVRFEASVSSKIDATTSNKGSSIGRAVRLLPQEKTTFVIAFTPKREMRDSLLTMASVEASKERNSEGLLTITYSTGQRIEVPITATLSTPFISGSSPKLYFGTCHTSLSCEGTLLLSNPTRVKATWRVTHIPGGGGAVRTTAIRVGGFDKNLPHFDDASVFQITPDCGELEGPTVSSGAAVACPPKDVNRSSVGIVPQRLVEASWATKTLTLTENLEKRHEASEQYPLPIRIIFKPGKNCRYSSRFRFSCEFGNTFDVLLEGKGTYEEHEHRPLDPFPR